jgi:HSP20 family protein
MAVVDKVKEKLEETIDSLRDEVAELSKKLREKLKGAGEEMKETAEELTQEVKTLTEKVKTLGLDRREGKKVRVRVDKKMAPTQYPISESRRTAERLFMDFYQEFGRNRRARWNIPAALPSDAFSTDWFRVDMCETDEEVHVTAELPGVERKDVEITVTEDRLTIRGEKKAKEEKRGRDYYHLERYHGAFHRSILLPCEVDADRVDAYFRDGVLAVNLAKTKAGREQTKKIRVRTG